MLDEIEELDLVLEHYAITWGAKLPSATEESTVAGWSEWGLKPQPRRSESEASDSDDQLTE